MTEPRFIRLAAPQVLPPRGTARDWRFFSACADEDVDPELFFPAGYGPKAKAQAREAKQVCRRCPVKDQCLAWALETGQASGVWGGKDELERARMRPSGSSSIDRCRAHIDLIVERRAQKVPWHDLAAELGVRTGTVQRAVHEFEEDRLREIDEQLAGTSGQVSA